jgi:predicted ferric reductase
VTALVLLLLYVLIPGLQVAVFIDGQPFSELPDTLNFASSITAFHWMLNGVLLSVKLPNLERQLPYDQRTRFHVLGNTGVGIMLLWHIVYKLLWGKQIDLVSWSLLVFIVLMAVAAVIWIPLPGFRSFRQAVRRGLSISLVQSYDWLKKTHNLLFLTLAGLLYIHVWLAELFAQVPWWSVGLYHAVFGAAIILYLGNWLRSRFLPRLALVESTATAGVRRLHFTAHPQLKYRPGQFAFLRFDHPTLRDESHPFSFSSIMGDDQVSFGIRELGDFTRQLAALEPGDTVRINGGFGNFYPRDRETSLVFIASGIGVVPFIGILRDFHRRADTRPIQFHLAVKSEAEIPEFEQLQALIATLPNLNLELLVAERDPRLYSIDYFRVHLPNPLQHHYYLCSSPTVRKIVEGALHKLGVPRSRVRYEGFNLG